ncbi:MAG TPA: N-acetyltransferase [Deltaproteobacteria bacterium]|nr:N-acetyltransferase [Deltaproteobacteria bacterium]
MNGHGPQQGFFCHETAIIDQPCKIGKETKIWHFSHIMAGAEIGEHCNIGQNVLIGSGVKIGNHVKIQNNVSVYEGVILEDHVFCGPSMVFTNVINPRSHISRKHEFKTTLVKEGATIGANATIVCGHTIGKYAFVGAGAVVTRDVPDYALVMGNPAKVVGWVCECGNRIVFHEGDSNGICKKCRKVYSKRNGGVTLANQPSKPPAEQKVRVIP